MATVHNQAEIGQIAKTVLMPGDPLRAKFIAEEFLENVICFNTVRNMLGFTGEYKGKKVSVMGSGMGMPSIGIYSYELYREYGVENIIRIGSAGAYSEELELLDVVLAKYAYSQSSYAMVQSGDESDVMYPSKDLNDKIMEVAKSQGIAVREEGIHSSDVFYKEDQTPYYEILHKERGCVCVEMESFALFHNAQVLGKNAACLLTISDSLVKKVETSSEERQKCFTNMMKIALETAISI